MQIQCDHCEAEYDLQLPPAAHAGGRNLKFRCASCGHSFVVLRSDGTRPPPSGAIAPRGYRVEEGGEVRQVPDMASLQRLVAAQQLGPAARVTGPDGSRAPAQAMPELSIFFELVHRAQRAASPLSPASRVLVEDAAPTDEWVEGSGPAHATRVLGTERRRLSSLGSPEAAADRSWLDDVDPLGSALTEEAPRTARVEAASAATPDIVWDPPPGEDPGPGAEALGDLDWLDSVPDAPANAPAGLSPERPADAGSMDLDSHAEAGDLSWLESGDAASSPTDAPDPTDLSWLEAVPESLDPRSSAPPRPAGFSWLGGDDDIDATEAPDPRSPAGVPDEDLNWLDAANAALASGRRLPPGSSGDGDGSPTDERAPAAAMPPASTGDWGDDLDWLMDSALDGVDGPPPDDQNPSDSGSKVDLGALDALPDDIRSLAQGLAVPAMTGSDASIKGVYAKAPIPDPREDEDLWGSAFLLGDDEQRSGDPGFDGDAPPSDEDDTTAFPDSGFAPGLDEDLDEYESFRRSRSSRMRWLAAAAAVLLAAGLFFGGTQEGGEVLPADAAGGISDAEPPAPVGEPVPESEAEMVAAATAAPAPAPGPEPVAPPEPAPAPAPKPEKAPAKASRPAKPAPRGAKALVDRGWTHVDRGRLSEASSAFDRAIKADASSGDAHFGAGYVAELRGKASDAYREYCLAEFHGKGDITLAREVAGRLRAIGRTCN